MTLSLVPAALLAVVSLSACHAEPAANVSSPPGDSASRMVSDLERARLAIHSDGRVHNFQVEVARSPEQQARGLMFREVLGDGEGMIFPFPVPRPASFWMRNTLIPLDMLFIRANGTIARIARRTTPLSDESIASGEPVAAVLELRGGRTEELAIEEGDRVVWPG